MFCFWVAFCFVSGPHFVNDPWDAWNADPAFSWPLKWNLLVYFCLSISPTEHCNTLHTALAHCPFLTLRILTPCTLAHWELTLCPHTGHFSHWNFLNCSPVVFLLMRTAKVQVLLWQLSSVTTDDRRVQTRANTLDLWTTWPPWLAVPCPLEKFKSHQ